MNSCSFRTLRHPLQQETDVKWTEYWQLAWVVLDVLLQHLQHVLMIIYSITAPLTASGCSYEARWMTVCCISQGWDWEKLFWWKLTLCFWSLVQQVSHILCTRHYPTWDEMNVFFIYRFLMAVKPENTLILEVRVTEIYFIPQAASFTYLIMRRNAWIGTQWIKKSSDVLQ